MARHRSFCLPLVLFSAVVILAGCNSGPSVSGAFDRNYNVSGPLRLELTNASGDVDITGSADGKVQVRGEVRASGFGFDNPNPDARTSPRTCTLPSALPVMSTSPEALVSSRRSGPLTL